MNNKLNVMILLCCLGLNACGSDGTVITSDGSSNGGNNNENGGNQGGSSGGSCENDKPCNDNLVFTEITIKPLNFSSNAVDGSTLQTYVAQKFVATGTHYDTQGQFDITHIVKWEVEDNSIISFTDLGVALPHQVGQTNIFATLPGVKSNEFSYKVTDSLVCGHEVGQSISTEVGGGVNDLLNPSLNDGACLDLHVPSTTINSDKVFISSPSIAFLNKIDYDTNKYFEEKGNKFALFNEEKNMNGNASDFCRHLSKIKFAGYSWELIRNRDLEFLKAFAEDKNLMSEVKWATDKEYFIQIDAENNAVFDFETNKVISPDVNVAPGDYPSNLNANRKIYVTCMGEKTPL